jgi:CO/xanthine dehydrogenase FAD-binding subunit
VKSAPFRYAAPASLDEVCGILAQEDESRVIAGGQSLVPMMVMRLARPDTLVDLKNITSLHAIDVRGDGVRVGAMVTQTALAAAPDAHPLVREAIPMIAHAQIRNRGTVGGSLAHADPAAELPAVAIALGARLRARGSGGERSIAARDFFVSYFTTALEPAEVLTAVEFPAPGPDEGWAIAEVARRQGDFALAGVVARLVVDDQQIVRDAAVVSFAIADRPIPSDGAAHALVGVAASVDSFSAAARLVASEVDPPADVHASSRYRRHAVAVLAERALTRALAVAIAKNARPEERPS